MSQTTNNKQNNPKNSSTPAAKQLNQNAKFFWSSYLNIRTITGKIVWLTFSFLTILFTSNILTLYQNQQTIALNLYVESTRSKIPALSNSLISSLNRSISLQKSYFMTGEKKYKKDLDFLWKAIIDKQAKDLFAFRTNIMEKENSIRLDSIQKLLPNLQKRQQELNLSFEKQAQHRSFYADKDKLSAETLQTYIAQESKLLNSLNDLLENKDAEFKTIRQLLIRLSTSSNQVLEEDLKQINQALNKLNTIILIATILAFIIIISLTYSLIRKFQESILQPALMLNQLADGELIRVAKVPDNEFSDIVQSANTLSKRLRKTSLFALEIGEGRFDTPFETATDQDMLGNALLQMSVKLQKTSEEEAIRNWATEGLSKFVLIFRENKENLRLWAETIIWQLVKYVEAQQGCFYILNEEDADNLKLELLAGYGLSEKHYKKEVVKIKHRFAEGLVGQCYKERSTIFFTEIPADYTYIQSAAGKSKPKSLLLVPLKLNDKIEGVIEIASLKVLASYQIEFVERLAENIAANILTLKANEKTQKLLVETQKQAEILKTQEEEMRQNFEELQATQEEMQRKGELLEQLLKESQKKELEIIQIKEEIEKAKRNFEIMTDAIPGVIFQYKKKKGNKAEFLYVSNGLEDIFGLPPQKFIEDSDNFVRAIHPDYINSLAENFKNSIKNRTIWQWQGKVVLPNGGENWITGTARPLVVDEDGTVIYSGMFSNITDLKNTEFILEKALAEAQEKAEILTKQDLAHQKMMQDMVAIQGMLETKLRKIEYQKALMNALIDNTQDSIIVIDKNYKVMLCNKAFKERYRGTAYDIEIGTQVLDKLGAESQEWKGYYDKALAGEAVHFIKNMPSSNSQVKQRQYHIYPVKQNDEVIGVSIFSREI